MPAALELTKVSCRFLTPGGTRYTPVVDITFAVPRGAFVSIVGPTGCGKSTVLNMAAGLLRPSEGQISVLGEPLTGINRHAAYLFQQDGLLPWKTVLENVVLGLEFRGYRRRDALDQGRVWLRKVGLAAFEDRFPHQLSGGMRKRCGLAQVLITDPEIILMDEPFSALDVQTRHLMENELLALWSEFRKTVLFVTHDLEEAIAMSDTVMVLSAGPEATIAGRYDIDLARPRNVAEVRFDRHFTGLYEAIWNDLKQGVMASYARSFQG